MNAWIAFLQKHGGQGKTRAELQRMYHLAQAKKVHKRASAGVRSKCGSSKDCEPGLVCSEKGRCRNRKKPSKRRSAEDIPLAVIKRRLLAAKKKLSKSVKATKPASRSASVRSSQGSHMSLPRSHPRSRSASRSGSHDY